MVVVIEVKAVFSAFIGQFRVAKLNVRTSSSTKGKIIGSLKINSVEQLRVVRKGGIKLIIN